MEGKLGYTLFYKYKSFDFGIKFKNKLRAYKARLAVPQNKVCRLAILKTITKHERRA